MGAAVVPSVFQAGPAHIPTSVIQAVKAVKAKMELPVMPAPTAQPPTSCC